MTQTSPATMTARRPPRAVWVAFTQDGSPVHVATAKDDLGTDTIDAYPVHKFVPAARAGKATEAEVERMAKALIRQFPPERMRFGIEYGFQQVIEVVLKLYARLPSKGRRR